MRTTSPGPAVMTISPKSLALVQTGPAACTSKGRMSQHPISAADLLEVSLELRTLS